MTSLLPLEILRCPVGKVALRELTGRELYHANKRIAAGQARRRDGSIVQGELSSGLASIDGRLAYAVVDGIAELLASRAIALDPDNINRVTLQDDKHIVQTFYDEFGWQETSDGLFGDTAKFVDTRPVVQDYLAKCRSRVKRHLASRGRFLLDVASGAVHFPEYQAYADGFERRICVDLSVAALRAAQKNVGERGVYILGDITNLPFEDGGLDGVVSLHTIYHVPEIEQLIAFEEVYRVLKPGSSAVVVYAWEQGPWRDRPLLERVAILPSRLVRRGMAVVRRALRARTSKPAASSAPRLYYYAYDYATFRRQQLPFQVEVTVFRSTTKGFLKKYVRERLFGRQLLRVLYWAEERVPHLAGRYGHYPMLVIRKPR